MSNQVKFNKTLTLTPVVLFGLAYMVPMTVFSTYGIVTQITEGMLPAAYILTLFVMLFTAYSYGQMVKVYPFAGSAYTYTQKSFNSHVGFLVGWTLLLDYLFLPMINYLIIGIYLSAEFPSVPRWIWIVGFILIVTIINIRGIKVITKVNFLLIVYQVVIIGFFIVLSMKALFYGTSTGSLFSIAPFFNPDVPSSAIFAGAAILCLSFLGFDAVTTLSEETKNATKVIPKAIFIVTITGGLLFIIVSYVGHLVYPDYASFTDPDSAPLDIATFIGGAIFKSMFLAGVVTGAFASAISSHASVSRLLFAMGRDSILPKKIFGVIHKKYNTPIWSTVAVSVAALSSLFFSLETVSSFISFGALVAFTFVNLSVIAHYFIRQKQRSGKQIVLYLILPAIGVILSVWLWTSLSQHAFTLGLTWVGIGVVYLLFLTRFLTRRPPELMFTEEE